MPLQATQGAIQRLQLVPNYNTAVLLPGQFITVIAEPLRGLPTNTQYVYSISKDGALPQPCINLGGPDPSGTLSLSVGVSFNSEDQSSPGVYSAVVSVHALSECYPGIMPSATAVVAAQGAVSVRVSHWGMQQQRCWQLQGPLLIHSPVQGLAPQPFPLFWHGKHVNGCGVMR